MEFYYYSPSETFVVLTADQFVGRDDGLLEQKRQDSHLCRRNRPFSEILQRGDQGKLLQKVGRLQGLEKHLGANGANL